jgi:2-polyprenyl-3-methyl-5-hydroxy-6-metoxy-1,4-benzoquinol methylase
MKRAEPDTLSQDRMTADQLWDYSMTKYRSQNPVAKVMLGGFYGRIAQVVKLLGDNDRVLEVGCGPGVSSRLIWKMLKGQEFQVSDVDERYIAKLRQNSFPLPVRRESVLNLERKDNEFDCVFSLEVLEHVPDYGRALSEIFRVSRKFVVLSVPNEPLWRLLNMARGKYLGDWGNTPSHVNRWSFIGFRRLVSKYGTVIKTYTPVPWTIVVALVRLAPDCGKTASLDPSGTV